MSGIDPNEGLKARNDLLWIVDHWTRLRAALVGSGGNALTGMPGAASAGGQSVIDLGVSDLMAEIEDNVARHYGHILIDEAPLMHGCDNECYRTSPVTPVEKCPQVFKSITTSSMPRLLREVAERYGHFTTDERLALAFCDDAHDYRERVRKVLERPAAPMYVGPCQHKGEDEAGCVGELYVREGRTEGRCRECGTPFTLAGQRAWLDAQMEDRLMTPTEIGRALKILGHEVKPGTVYKWVQRGRLSEVTDGLYRLAEARALIEKGGAA